MCEYKVESTITYCEFDVLLTDTVQSLIKLQAIHLSDGDNIYVEGKLGIDGSGSHQTRHQLAENDDEDDNDDDDGEKKCETSYIGIFWCPLRIKQNNNSLV